MFTQNQKFVFNLKSACDNTDISFRDNMSTLELALNMVAEAAATEISKQTNSEGVEANQAVARAGGSAAKTTKDSIESATGTPVITSKTAKELNHMVTSMIEASAEMVLQSP
jgi:hypothetical protein